MQFSDEDLIAFLLGDASHDLAQQIQRSLKSDRDVADRLGQLRLVLDLADSVDCGREPPADLVECTLARIDLESQRDRIDRQDALHCNVESEPWVQPVKVEFSDRRRSVWDSTALAVCLTILCCLALPALIRVRFESRKSQCAYNLKATGADLINYALSNPENRFPRVATEGPGAFAGVYAVYLRDSGAEITPGQLQCASLLGTEASARTLQLQSIPSFSELRQLAADELSLWQRAIGGDFAYNLGVEEQGGPRAPQHAGRSHFAILADAPVIDGNLSGLQRESFVAHDGRGINIFFEDGRIVFISSEGLAGLEPSTRIPAATVAEVGMPDQAALDNPFHNQLGQHEVGLHVGDASLAPSHFPPLAK